MYGNVVRTDKFRRSGASLMWQSHIYGLNLPESPNVDCIWLNDGVESCVYTTRRKAKAPIHAEGSAIWASRDWMIRERYRRTPSEVPKELVRMSETLEKR